MTLSQFKSSLRSTTQRNFEERALWLFRHQAEKNEIYKKFISYLGIDIDKIQHINEIPFLPIEFFKSQKIITGEWAIEKIFESSGTTGDLTSKHFVEDEQFYLDHATLFFESCYGPINNMAVVALLPSYLERNNSSLVAMAQHFIVRSGHGLSGFYLDDFDGLAATLTKVKSDNTPTLFLGVTFGLLDFSEKFPLDLSEVIIMETGGMKGRKKELTRSEVHQLLSERFNTDTIHSEYGMTELLSQGYAKSDEKFIPAPWMKVLVRSLDDPLENRETGRGGLNIIDLANVHSCAFIATQDQGESFPDGSFKVSGRIDHSDVRGCNLLLTNT